MKITSEKLAEVINSKSKVEDVKLETALIFFDSRKVVPNSIFVAIKTDKNDGATFIKDAFANGAVAAISETNPDNLPNVFIVQNAIEAFQRLGAYVRSLYKGVVIGITGSSGKTTSRALAVKMLSAFGRVFAADNAFNNHIGTPYNLCRLDFNTDYAVFEMGMDHTGEISTLVDMVAPNIAAITNVYPMHIGNFHEFRDIAYAKSEIFEKVVSYIGELNFRGRLAIINSDTNFFEDVLISQVQKYGLEKMITFGKNGDVKLKSYRFTNQGQTEVEIEIGGNTYYHLDFGLGERYAYNATFAVTLASALGLNIDRALDAIADFQPLKGRGRVYRVKLPAGFEVTIVDDSYNGQPDAVKQAIQTLGLLPQGTRKVAVIGKMTELGDNVEKEHCAVGKALVANNIDVVVGIGPETKTMLAEVPNTKLKIYQSTVDGLFEFLLEKVLRPDDVILIKGSHYASRVFELAEKFEKLSL